MLHMRRRGLGMSLGAPAWLLSGVCDRAIAADPGLLRLMMATRGALAVFLTTLAGIGFGKLLREPPIERRPPWPKAWRSTRCTPSGWSMRRRSGRSRHDGPSVPVAPGQFGAG